MSFLSAISAGKPTILFGPDFRGYVELGTKHVVLMRGHGNTVVGPDIRETVSRAIYTELNARLLLQTLRSDARSSTSTRRKPSR